MHQLALSRRNTCVTWLPIVALLFLSASFPSLAIAQGEVKETVFDFKALTATPLNPRVLKSTEKDGIVTEEVMFHSHMDGDKSVDIFAFFSYPKDAKGLPAFVWNQAGLGRASTYWTEKGAQRGYAALCIDMPIPGYRSTGNYPIGMGFDANTEPRDNPIYHGAVALLKAVSYLESRPEVDKTRIGMAGSSWGGFYTTMMAGIDRRIHAASAMFGTGNMHLGNTWWDGSGNSAARDAAFREKWRTTLDPAYRLPQTHAAIAWFTGTNDHFYWMPAVMKTYEMAPVPKHLREALPPGAKNGIKHLSLLHNWDHGLTPTLDEQVFVWLDIHLQGKPAFLHVSALSAVPGNGTPVARWTYGGPRQLDKAYVILSYGDAGNWEGRVWSTLPATVSESGLCTVELPASETPYYISGTVVDKDGFITSTPLVRVSPKEMGIKNLPDKPDANGAVMWGDFEKAGLEYLKANGLANLTPNADAHQGQQSIALGQGRTTVRALYFTAGLPHRLTVYMKADKATPVTVELNGTFDGKAQNEKKEFNIGTEWTPITLDYMPPQTLAGALNVSFVVPEGVAVLADSLSFQPQ